MLVFVNQRIRFISHVIAAHCPVVWDATSYVFEDIDGHVVGWFYSFFEENNV